MSSVILQSALLIPNFNHDSLFVAQHCVLAITCILKNTLERVHAELVSVDNFQKGADCCISYFNDNCGKYFYNVKNGKLRRDLECFDRLISTVCDVGYTVDDGSCGWWESCEMFDPEGDQECEGREGNKTVMQMRTVCSPTDNGI